jgi:UDP-glucose 4-epimerase
VKKAVVIGGSGFIGSHVADELTKEGFQTIVFDRRESKWLKKNQKMIVGDILDISALDDAIKGASFVYNFAAIADLNEAINKPIATAEVNILGNLNVLEVCKKYKIERYIYASTVYVYSKEGSFYRCSKQASESFVEEYFKSYGLEYSILRYGSLYGPRSDGSNGLYSVVSYQGHPDSMREYIHVEDAAKASVEILEKNFRNESIVLTGQEPMRVLDMLNMLSEILNLSNDAIDFIDSEYVGHYVRTPYSFQPRLGRKFIPSIHVDLGQGLLQLISQISNERNRDT